MVAPNHDRRFDFPFLHQIVDRQAELRPLAIPQPADARRQALELDALARQIDPAPQNTVLGKQFQNQLIGHMNVRSLARQRHPAEGPASFAKQRTDVCRHEAGKVVGILHAALERKRADVVAVIECHRSHLLQPQHAFHVRRYRIERFFLICLRITFP